MKIIRHIGSLSFVLGLFTAVFVGIPWFTLISSDPVIPLWLRIAVFCLLGGILVVLLSLALEQNKSKHQTKVQSTEGPEHKILLLNSSEIPGKEINEVLGLVQGHTVFAIWLGKDLSAIVRLILGGELTEYTEMMGKARSEATNRMLVEAAKVGADGVINVRYMTTSVVGTAAELLVYGTAVKFSE